MYHRFSLFNLFEDCELGEKCPKFHASSMISDIGEVVNGCTHKRCSHMNNLFWYKLISHGNFDVFPSWNWRYMKTLYGFDANNYHNYADCFCAFLNDLHPIYATAMKMYWLVCYMEKRFNNILVMAGEYVMEMYQRENILNLVRKVQRLVMTTQQDDDHFHEDSETDDVTTGDDSDSDINFII